MSVYVWPCVANVAAKSDMVPEHADSTRTQFSNIRAPLQRVGTSELYSAEGDSHIQPDTHHNLQKDKTRISVSDISHGLILRAVSTAQGAAQDLKTFVQWHATLQMKAIFHCKRLICIQKTMVQHLSRGHFSSDHEKMLRFGIRRIRHTKFGLLKSRSA